MSETPPAVLRFGTVRVTWERVRTTSALNYPLPNEERWLPEGTEGWAARQRYGWVLAVDPDSSPPWDSGGRFGITERDFEMLGERFDLSYSLPQYAYPQEPSAPEVAP